MRHLRYARLDRSKVELLDKWHDLKACFTKQYLLLMTAKYIRTWRLISSSSSSLQDFRDILLDVQFMFSVPVANAEVERLFSCMKHIKTELFCSLGTGRLENIVRVGREGPHIINMIHYEPWVLGAYVNDVE